MSRAIPTPIRQSRDERHQARQVLATIARELGLPLSTVRGLWRLYQQSGEAGPAPGYRRCGRTPAQRTGPMVRAACWLKRHHRSWEAGLIYDLLCRRWPDRAVPGPMTSRATACPSGSR